MAVAFDAVTNQRRTGTADPQTFTHTPVGTPKGVMLVFAQANETSSDIDTIDYGGVALSRVGSVAVDPIGEPGTAEMWFLGSGISTGAQTVTIEFVNVSPTNDYLFSCITVTATTDTEVLDSGIISGGTADPTIALTYGGRTGLACAALMSGRGIVGDIVWDAGITSLDGFLHGFGYTHHTARQTTAGSSDFTMGATVLSDDVAMAAFAISEVAGGIIPQIMHYRQQQSSY